MTLKNLSKYTYEDTKKKLLIEKAMSKPSLFYSKGDVDFNVPSKLKVHPKLDRVYEELESDLEEADLVFTEFSKVCPECGDKFPSNVLICPDCLVRLQEIKKNSIDDLTLNPTFEFDNPIVFSDFSEILTDENILKIAKNPLDIENIVLNIKKTAFKRLNSTIEEYEIDFDDLSLRDRILLFAKCFVDVEYKSYGPELGLYKFNRIYLDDRQLSVLMITTVLHELTHFLVKEILTHILCSLLECGKNTLIESLIAFILSFSPLNALIDEYAAHTVEGRFTLYGYQDYSSYLSIEKTIDLGSEEIEMLKTIGNTFADIIKGIFESFIDRDMLYEIKDEFSSHILDSPNYANLRHENCTLLNGRGLDEAVRFILTDGIAISKDNIQKIEEYNGMW